jgi:hypothetical protein
MTKITINKSALEIICHSHSHSSHRLVVRNFWRGSAAATTTTQIFYFGYGLDYVLVTLALERDTLSWLATSFKVFFRNYYVCQG